MVFGEQWERLVAAKVHDYNSSSATAPRRRHLNHFTKLPFSMIRTILLVCLLGGVVGSLGCQQSGLSGLAKLEGTLYLDDQKLDGATIVFSPEPGQPEPIRAASAISRQNGSFSAMTLKYNDGIYPGKYRMSVEKVEVIDTRTPEQKKRDASTEIDGNSKIPPSPEFQFKAIVPKKYNDFHTSGLTVEVGKSGQKDFEIRLTSQ